MPIAAFNYDPRLDPNSSKYDPLYAQQLKIQAGSTVAPFEPSLGNLRGSPTPAQPKPPFQAPDRLPGSQVAPGEPFQVPALEDPTTQKEVTEEAQYFGSPTFVEDANLAAAERDQGQAVATAGGVYVEGIGWIDPKSFYPDLGTDPGNTPGSAIFSGPAILEEIMLEAMAQGYSAEDAQLISLTIGNIEYNPEDLGGSFGVFAEDYSIGPTPEPFDQDAWLLNFAIQRGFATWEEYEAWMKAYTAGEVPGWWEPGPQGYVDPFEEGGSGGSGFGYSPPPSFGGGGRRGGGSSRGTGSTSKLIQTIRFLIPGA